MDLSGDLWLIIEFNQLYYIIQVIALRVSFHAGSHPNFEMKMSVETIDI